MIDGDCVMMIWLNARRVLILLLGVLKPYMCDVVHDVQTTGRLASSPQILEALTTTALARHSQGHAP